MKFRRFTLVASLILTAAAVLLVLFFNISVATFRKNSGEFLTDLAFLFVMLLIINFLAMDLLYSFYNKRQIRRISTILPDEMVSNGESALNFETLGERFNEFSQKSADEIDTMKEMEIYRKEYLGNVSHEMKTPLFSIQGYVETLMDGGVENLSIRDKYLERINKSVERLLNIVTDLDMINKYESGEISINPVRFDINALVTEVFELLDLEAANRHAKLSLQSTHNQIFVKADKQKISQVLINLVSNAIYYSNRESAQITISVKHFRSKVSVSVSDNGMGIKPEVLPRIFERFFRVESSRSRSEGGSGLGLAIVKHILEAHHETIEVRSVYLEGTTFTFLLPAA